MAKRRKSKRKAPAADFAAIKPTPEREAKNQTQSAGMARRVQPMIDIMRNAGVLSASQHEALDAYRTQAIAAERSPVRSCCDNSPRGDGGGPSMAITSARLEVERMHGLLKDYSPGDAKAMIDVLEAIVRDDMSLSQYCVRKYGGRERYNAKGKLVAIVPRSERRVMKLERINLLYAAGVIGT